MGGGTYCVDSPPGSVSIRLDDIFFACYVAIKS